MTYHDGIILPQLALEQEDAWMDCTSSEDCQAHADEHQPDCLVEKRLREDLGF